MDKRTETTRGMISRQSELQTLRTNLEGEIAQLEKTLQEKRLALAEVLSETNTVEERLRTMSAEVKTTVADLEKLESEELKKSHECRTSLEALRLEESKVAEEEKSFAVEREELLGNLRDAESRVKDYSQRSAELLRQGSMSAIHDVVEKVCVLLKMREAHGPSFLARPLSAEKIDANAANSDEQRLVALLRTAESAVANLMVRRTALLAKVHDAADKLPVLEAMKRTAASARQFKEAQSKTEEIKKVQADRAAAEEELQSLEGQIDLAKKEVALREAELKQEMQRMSIHLKEFVKEYDKVLASAKDWLSNFKTANTVGVLVDDADIAMPLWESCIGLVDSFKAELDRAASLFNLKIEESPVSLQSSNNEKKEDPDPYEGRSRAELESLLATAIETEQYDECERLQELLDRAPK